ncbi:MAG TPA: quinone-dependent dihydroorotate dehydrogenase [Steroidobacteraceae bacterium]|nr:quinone-dependent dihydroorotate dehydrogenase [Steroidobacteraceae bacterium]
MYALARALLFRLDAERAHRLTLASLDAGWRVGLLRAPRPAPGAVLQGREGQAGAQGQGGAKDQPAQAVRLMGLEFANRVGLAAGFDKDAACVDALGALGFGFIEVGTLTPLAQTGNERPRVFRLPRARAVINRMGFPNGGVTAAVARLARRRFAGICGVNIGKNAATPLERAADDYVVALRAVYAVADYVAINISSPNTQGLRTLQGGDQLRPLLTALLEARAGLAAAAGRRVPLLVKLSPDLAPEELAATAEVIAALQLDGVIATNTTLDRAGVSGLPDADRPGGLSGAPLLARSLDTVAKLRTLLGPGMPIIGVGGIASAADARAMRTAGADLVQVYTGLIYRGPALVRELVAAGL